ncbi:FGGY family carbohydrate kinase [Serratia proteamaculans]
MSYPVILAIDEGTTNAKAVALDRAGMIRARGSVPLVLNHPQPGLAEQDPLAIWQAVQQAIIDCLAQLPGCQVAAVAVGNQRESVMIWQRSDGRPLTPLIGWQDRRSEGLCQQLNDDGHGAEIAHRSGLAIDPMFPAAKVSGLLAALPDGIARAAAGELCIGTVDSWLVWQLSGGTQFVTDYSNASRTQLFNIHQGCWDDHLLALFNVPREALAQLIPSAAAHIEVRCDTIPGLAIGTPIMAIIGDSHAALYAQRRADSDVIKATYGTGSSLMMSMPDPVLSENGLSTTVAWHDGQLRYAFEGNIAHTGSGAAWLGRMLGINDPQALTSLAASTQDNQGIYFVPALSGLGAPWWDLQARGLLCGLTDAATPAVLARVALESMVYQIADVFFAMQQACDRQLPTLCVDGAATRNKWLMQLQADVLQRPLMIAAVPEVSALGAALLAGRNLGWWQDFQDLQSFNNGSVIYPRHDQAAVMAERYQGWQAAITRCRFRP